MLPCTVPVLFESSGDHAVRHDPANDDWVQLLGAIEGERFEVLARRYSLALYHLRTHGHRPTLAGQIEVVAPGKQQALEGMLEVWEQRKAHRQQADSEQTAEVFVEAMPAREAQDLPEALRDFSTPPPSLSVIQAGAGRPPCDALCLLRAFLTAPLLGSGDDPTAVHRLLHNNPAFAHLCGFLGRTVLKQPGELTSRRLPSLSVCEEFSEVMTRYGLWHQARLEQVRDNLASGVLEVEPTVCFDTTHLEANSHCANVRPADATREEGQKPKYRKVPRMCKRCDCGEEHWETCIHGWVPTDQGAAVVIKGPTRVYWAHKASVAAFGDSEIPFDTRVCQYAADHDGKTLVPHLEALRRELPRGCKLPEAGTAQTRPGRAHRPAPHQLGPSPALCQGPCSLWQAYRRRTCHQAAEGGPPRRTPHPPRRPPRRGTPRPQAAHRAPAAGGRRLTVTAAPARR